MALEFAQYSKVQLFVSIVYTIVIRISIQFLQHHELHQLFDYTSRINSM